MKSEKSNRVPLLLLVALTLVGACVSGALLMDHDGGWQADAGGVAAILGLCDSERLPAASCREVVESKWGSFDFTLGGARYVVPTSFLGFVYFVAIAIWFGVLWILRAATRRVLGVSTLVIAGGAAVSIVLLIVMAGAIAKWCPLCVMVHAANGGVLLTAIWAWRHACERVDARREVISGESAAAVRASRACVIASMGIVAMTGMSWLYYDAMRSAKHQWHKVTAYRQLVGEMRSDPNFLLREYFAQPVVELGEDLASIDGGTSTSAWLVIFGDFSCKACACFTRKWDDQYSRAFGSDVTVEFRHATDAEHACEATGGPLAAALMAEAVRISAGEDMYQRFRRAMFAHRKSLSHEAIESVAGELGLDIDRLRTIASSDGVLTSVEHDGKLARSLSIGTTPAIFLNGRRVPELCLKSQVFWDAVAPTLRGSETTTASIGGNGL